MASRYWRLLAVALVVPGCAGPKSPGVTGSTPSSVASHSSSAGDHRVSRSSEPNPAWSLVVEPNEGMDPIYALISSARHSLDMTMYELADPRAVSILESDAAQGVRVRVLLDREYSGGSVNAGAYSQLASHGIEVRWAYSGAIFHQKTITVDGATSAIMTLNLTSRYYATTRDFAVVTNDMGDVSAIENVFNQDWSSPGPPYLTSAGDNLVWSPGSIGALVHLIDSARHSLLVENEEMNDSTIEGALESAASRGVDVEVVMTYSPDWAGALARLSAAGVHVRTFASDASLYVHAKVMVADGATAFLGSENFSVASLDYNRELGLITTVPAIVEGTARTVEADYSGANSTPIPTNPPSARKVWCRATAAPANDGYPGDYNVSVTSNQPHTKATASDATDHWSDYTDGDGFVVIRLYHTQSGESISVAVGSAVCATPA